MQTRSLRKRFLICAALALLLLPGLIACTNVIESSDAANSNSVPNNNGASMEEQQNRTPAVSVDPRLVSANTRFGLKLYGEVLRKNGGKNVFVSGSSVALALAMTYNGADGDTKQAMARALEIEGMSAEDVNRAFRDMSATLANPDPKVQLQIANSLWGRKGVAFKPDFIQRTKDYYSAEVEELNFDDPAAPQRINSWVSDKTKGKIDKIVDQISPDAILFLINAIYFKGKWSDEFEKAKTKDDTFTLADGRQKKHPMMNQSGEYKYLAGDNFQAVSLPYGGKRVSMYVFLPAQGAGLDAFHKSLTAENWEKWMNAFNQTPGDIALPRFKTEFEAELNDALKALGMGVAFEPSRANFSRMAQMADNIYISKVKHKSFVEVNEEGTEAAAVTSTEMRATSMQMPRERFSMKVDRPFFFAIRDNQTGAVLFMGSILDPQ
ncbi:MAG TPA: serpin family protein [Blastocatellia bacterium]|nr:serpin family protein [Blastocatellia bacterium]